MYIYIYTYILKGIVIKMIRKVCGCSLESPLCLNCCSCCCSWVPLSWECCSHDGVYSASNGVWVDGACQSGIHTNVRTQGFPAEHCIVMSYWCSGWSVCSSWGKRLNRLSVLQRQSDCPSDVFSLSTSAGLLFNIHSSTTQYCAAAQLQRFSKLFRKSSSNWSNLHKSSDVVKKSNKHVKASHFLFHRLYYIPWTMYVKQGFWQGFYYHRRPGTCSMVQMCACMSAVLKLGQWQSWWESSVDEKTTLTRQTLV